MPITSSFVQTKNPDSGEANFTLRRSWNNVKSIDHIIDTYFLDEITFSGKKVKFSTSSRQDLQNAYRLDKIELFDGAEELKECTLSYNYMNNTGTIKEKRLMLSNVKIGEQEYDFDYFAGDLPAKDSYKQDFWGFYSSRPTGFIPKIYVYPNLAVENRYRCYPIQGQTAIEIPGSDRTCDIDNVTAGTLSKITYPTKGYTKFLFEPNEFYNDDVLGDKIQGGGIRIAAIEKYSGANELALKKEYSYETSGNSSGVLIHKLAFATPTNYTFDPNAGYRDALYEWECTGVEWTDAKKCEYFTVRSSNNFFPLTSMDGHQVGYTHLTITEQGNGKIEKEYYPPRNFATNASTVNSTSVYGRKTFTDVTYNPIVFRSSNSNQSTFSGNCLNQTVYENGQYVTKDLLTYTSPFGSDYISDIECTYADEPDDFIAEGDVDYVGGNGYFTPAGYNSSGAGYDDYYVFGIYDYRFRIKKIDDLFFTGLVDDKTYGSFNYQYVDWGEVKKTGTNIFPFAPLTESVGDTLLYEKIKSEVIYREGSSTPLKESYFKYENYCHDTSAKEVFGIVSNNHYVVPNYLKATLWDAVGTSGDDGKLYFFANMFSNYFIPKAWAKYSYKVNSTALLTEVKIKENFNGNIVERVEQFDYNNNFLIKQEKLVSNSMGNSEITNYYYPNDNPSGITTNSTTLNKLTTDNMNAIVLKKEVLLNGTSLIAGEINNYRIENSIVVPSNIAIAKTDGIYETRYYFDKFDGNGNVLQAHKSGDKYVSYVWSYNSTYPVAKIDDFTYPVDGTVISTIQSLQNFTTITDSNLDNLRSLNTGIRQLFPNGEHITTYTYDPLVGLTSQTDPNGVITYYEYDSQGRLINVKNDDKKLVNSYEYNYGN